jgi:hypothetical protein
MKVLNICIALYGLLLFVICVFGLYTNGDMYWFAAALLGFPSSIAFPVIMATIEDLTHKPFGPVPLLNIGFCLWLFVGNSLLAYSLFALARKIRSSRKLPRDV